MNYWNYLLQLYYKQKMFIPLFNINLKKKINNFYCACIGAHASSIPKKIIYLVQNWDYCVYYIYNKKLKWYKCTVVKMKRCRRNVRGTDVVSRSSKMSPTVLTSSLLRSMMGLSLLVRGKVCACLLGSRTRCRPSYRSSWLGGLMLVRLKSSSWKSVALEKKIGQKKCIKILKKKLNRYSCCVKSKMADAFHYTWLYTACWCDWDYSVHDGFSSLIGQQVLIAGVVYTILYKNGLHFSTLWCVGFWVFQCTHVLYVWM